MSITIEDMKAELESNGYEIETDEYWAVDSAIIRCPDGAIYKAIKGRVAIQTAYAHLQQQRILDDLRALKADIWALDENTHPDIHNAYVAKRVIEFLIKHNITGDES